MPEPLLPALRLAIPPLTPGGGVFRLRRNRPLPLCSERVEHGSISLFLTGHRPKHRPQRGGLCRDGGLTDYHLDIDYGIDEGNVFYPHFSSQVITGWFDRALPWRRARRTLHQTLLVAPSPAFVASLPFGKIPDRRDFHTMDDATRMRAWRTVMAESARMADELRTLIDTERLAGAIQPI